jgi:hypothetical protein
MLHGDYGQLRPWEIDDFTSTEWEALMRDYQTRNQDG